jgi:hypothetical protein
VENVSTKLSIDEQLAEANRQFDARLAAEKKAALAPEKPKRNSRPVVKPRVGVVAHHHERIRDDEAFDEDCLYVEHNVRDRKGFMINDRRYKGRVIVPQCVANYLSMMENSHRRMERGILEDRGRKLSLGELKG